MKKYILVLLFAIFPINSMQDFDTYSFNEYATLFGNKSANLRELQKIVKTITGTQKTFAVPEFFAISHEEIVDYFKSVTWKNPSTQQVISAFDTIIDLWDLFKRYQPKSETVLTQKAQEALLEIRNKIGASLEKTPFFIRNDTRFAALSDFLNEAKRKNVLLMVRSTGREDSADLSNAGGNESIAAVQPNRETISKAMAQVLESYFSVKSIGQRLALGDKKLFDDPFMPVLLQVMIGEEPGGGKYIPVSGVLFSQEAEGHTPGVTHIQATYGHNEAVVNGLVPVDSFYIGSSGIIHPIIMVKPKRLVSDINRSKLVLIDNPVSLQKIPSLDPKTISSLKIGSDTIEKYYNYPVDIEFVFLNNIIYLVQTRPIEKPQIIPSYIKDDFLKSRDKDDLYKVYAIGTGGGKVRSIKDHTQVIVANNLRKALDIFINMPNKDNIQAIFVSEIAPATSHEATIFRANGKPILYVQNISEIQALLSHRKNQLLIDTQRGLIVNFSVSEQFKSPEDVIVENAWFVHPIPEKISLFPEFLIQLTEQDMRKLAPEELFKGIKTPDLLTMMKNGSAQQALMALKTILARTFTAIKNEEENQNQLTREGKETNFNLISDLKQVFSHMLNCGQEFYYTVQNEKNLALTETQKRLLRLYATNFFEALLSQVPLPQFVNDISVGFLIKIEREEEKIIKELNLQGQELRSYIVQYAQAARYVFTDDLATLWKTYITNLSLIDDQTVQQLFAQMMYHLAQLDMIPLWINTSFAQATEKYGADFRNITKTLITEYQYSKKYLEQLQAFKQQIDTINIGNWEKPESFQKQFNAFKKFILTPFQEGKDGILLSQLALSQPLGKYAALSVMQTLVNVFDISIKAITGSRLYINPIHKVKNFKILLNEYYELLKSWTGTFVANDLEKLVAGPAWTLQDYLNAIQKIINQSSLDAYQLQGSREFNVNAALLGSKAAFTLSIGSSPTLEDMFTLTHQNLLVVLAVMSKQIGMFSIPVPSLLREFLDKIGNITIEADFGKSKGSLIGVSFEEEILTYYYNIPLRFHSNTFQIKYHGKSKQMTLAVQFLGVGVLRWYNQVALTYLIASILNMSFVENPTVIVEKGIMSFEWKLNNNALSVPNYLALLVLNVSPYWDQLSKETTMIELLAQEIDSNNKQKAINRITDIIVDSAQKHQEFVLWLPELVRIKKNDIADPGVQKLFIIALNIIDQKNNHLKRAVLEMFGSLPTKILISFAQDKRFLDLVLKAIEGSESYEISIGMLILEALLSSDMEFDQEYLDVITTQLITRSNNPNFIAMNSQLLKTLIKKRKHLNMVITILKSLSGNEKIEVSYLHDVLLIFMNTEVKNQYQAEIIQILEELLKRAHIPFFQQKIKGWLEKISLEKNI